MNKILAVAAVLTGMVLGLRADEDVFAETFRNPPRTAKPHTWYHLMNGNVTKEGITCDFEALAKAGIGGVQMFDAGCNIPPGPLKFNSPEWFDLLKHAAAEAKRLGLEICIPNCSGWSSSGGPWITPDKGMKFLTTSVTDVTGGAKFVSKLPRDKNDNGFYQDVAVVAYPVPAAEQKAISPVRTNVKDGTAVFSADAPFTVAGVSFALKLGHWVWSANAAATIEISDDGKAFKPLEKYSFVLATSGSVDAGARSHAFPSPVTAKAIRLSVSTGADVGKLSLVNPRLEKGRRLSGINAKTFFVRMEPQEDMAPVAPDQLVKGSDVIDLTSKMGPDGTLTWEAPVGRWRVIRLGMRCNGRHNHPASKFGVGLEVDKLSASALDYHFDQYVARLCRHLGDLAGGETGFNNILIDSYEVGSQNWTQGLEKEFLRRMGYSMTPWYPVFTGLVVDSVEKTERFLEDFRRVIADLFAENYSGELTKKCHEYGLLCSVEPYGNSPSDNLQYGQAVDVPMSEFWSSANRAQVNYSRHSTGNSAFAGYIAHVWGRRYAGAEAFTANPSNGGRWQTTPYAIKSQGDFAYCAGVNRIIYHRFCHQPWAGDKYLPGMTMGKWGMHLDRTQTWWDYSQPWFAYQTRCQWMLQEGTFVADALFFAGEQAPNQGGNTDGNSGAQGGAFALPDGYRWDIAPTDALLACRVENGRVIVPGGVAYRFLVLPEVKAMSPRVLRKVGELMDAGATVVAKTKPVRAPGLADYPASDAEVKRLADEVWAKGVLACSATEAVQRLGIPPDVTFIGPVPTDAETNFMHRRGKGADWYFVACSTPVTADVDISFRTSGREPELWDAESGEIRPASVWCDDGLRTRVRVPFRPCGSMFVVFRKPAKGDHAVSLNVTPMVRPKPTDEPPLEILEAKYGLLTSTQEFVADKFIDITDRVRTLVKDNRLKVSFTNRLAGRDPVPNQYKHGQIRYRYGLVEKTLTYRENEPFLLPLGVASLDRPRTVELVSSADGALVGCATVPASATVAYASGKTKTLAATAVPEPIEVKGAWAVCFPAKFAPNKLASGPDEVLSFPSLSDWAENALEGVKYFSGTATYRKTIPAADVAQLRASAQRIMLDLGEVKHFAEVTANGKTYPVLWRPPFRLDVTDALADGELKLEIKVTNLWPNRLIGDAHKPEDCAWKKAEFREAIVDLPDWVKKGEKSPTGRFTFTTWKHWDKADTLLPSGLLGPVKLCGVVEIK